MSKHWPLWLSLVAFAAGMAGLFFFCRRMDGGHFTYPLDDTYIHMSLAKNLAFSKVWSTSPTGFSACSSSLLWPMLIALVDLTAGVNDLTPLLLASIFAAATLLTAYIIIARREGASSGLVVLMLFALLIGTPLLPLALSGMEHTCQMFLDLLFLYCAVRLGISRRMTVLPQPADPGTVPTGRIVVATEHPWFVLLLAPLVVMIRFEGVFLVGATAVFLFLMGRRWLAIGIALLGVAPVVGYALYATRHGAMYLPNSVLLKGSRFSFHSPADIVNSLGLRGIRAIVDSPTVLPLSYLAAGLLAVILGRRMAVNDRRAAAGERCTALIALTLLVVLIHSQMAAYGWFFRYEAYLIVLLIVAIFVGLARLIAHVSPANGSRAASRPVKCLGYAMVSIIIAAPLLMRGKAALAMAPPATRNIYQQQYQMALFLQRYYAGKSVAVNDIGEIGYRSGIKTLDLCGLDSVEVARAKLGGYYTSDFVETVVRKHDVRIAVIYESWLVAAGGVPADWIKLGSWTIPDNRICGSDTVSFFAIDKAQAPAMAGHLKEFSVELPNGVTQSLIAYNPAEAPK